MCGFTGYINIQNNETNLAMEAVISRMGQTLRHRGPDDSGVWVDEKAGVALGHTRLSIIDLSEHGHQPMVSGSGRYVIAYNGEVYNFQRLRETIENDPGPVDWAGHSDTEVMLEAFERWGVKKAVKSFNGMFAFALWDRKERKLSLARDRSGKKPLYYGWINGVFMFGSELKSIKAHPGFSAEVDRDALSLLMRYSYILSPHSIYKGVHKLLPGTILTLDHGQLGNRPRFSPFADNEPVCPERYWSARECFESGASNRFSGSLDEAADRLDTLFRDAVGIRMISDVPLGALLSGGIDSSSVVAIMQAISDRAVRTFTIGFNEDDFDEAVHARAVAGHLGTDHTELYVSPEMALDVIPGLPELYDEPFADSSQIPTFLVSQLARESVTVALSGDGGDELFTGYHRHTRGDWLYGNLRRFPGAVRGAVARLMMAVPADKWSRLFGLIKPVIPADLNQPNAGDKIHKLAKILDSATPEDIYRQLVSQWDDPESLAPGSAEPRTVITDRSQWLDDQDFTRRLMYIDLAGYLADDILTKVDRASMGVSLEIRCPVIDYRIVEFAATLPKHLRLKNGRGKLVLRKMLCKYVPEQMVERPKRGFSIPLDVWLRGPLRDWAESLLDSKRLREEGYLDPAPVRRAWEEHVSGKLNWRSRLWNILMFQAWLDRWA